MNVSNNSCGAMGVFCVGAFVYLAGCQDMRGKDEQSLRLGYKEKLIGGALMLAAVIERVVYYSGMGAPFVSGSQVIPPQGEWWKDNFYPYDQYPHGHLDCAHGSTVFDPSRSSDNEQSRWNHFGADSICVRGIGDLIKRVGEKVITCYANGTKTTSP